MLVLPGPCRWQDGPVGKQLLLIECSNRWTYGKKSIFVTDTTLIMNSEYHDNFQSAQAVAGQKLGRTVQKSLFDRFEWLKQLHELCLPDHEPLIVRSAEGDAEAWMFLMKNGVGRYTALANWYNFTYRPIFTGNFDEVTKLALLADLAKQLKNQSHYIEMSPLPDEDNTTGLIERAFEQAGWMVFPGKG